MNSGWYMYMGSKCIVFPACFWSNTFCISYSGNFPNGPVGKAGRRQNQWFPPTNGPRLSAARREVVTVRRVYFMFLLQEWELGYVRYQDVPCHPWKLPGMWGPSFQVCVMQAAQCCQLPPESHSRNYRRLLYLRQPYALVCFYEGSFLYIQFSCPIKCLFPFSYKISSSVPVSCLTHQLSISCFELFHWFVFLFTGIKIFRCIL